jgi:chitinase
MQKMKFFSKSPSMTLRSAILASLLTLHHAHAEPKVVAYVPNWIDLETFSATIDYQKLTHIDIAFSNPKNAEGDLSYDKKNDILITRAHAAGVKVLLSIGGGSASGDKTLKARYFDLLTPAKRDGFAKKLAECVTQHQLDGLDVDIEGPSINKDYGGFLTALSAALKPAGKLMTAALSKGYGGENVPDSVFPLLDFVNIMAYDGTGYWEPKAPGQHSSLAMAKENAAYWLARGLPKEKAILGVPFYGYGFGSAFKKRDYPYATILAEHPGAEKSDEVGQTIYYNGIPTITAKTKFAIEQGLGGIMIWSLDSDVKGPHSLLTAIHTAITAKSDK